MVLTSYLILRTIDPRFVQIPVTLVTPIPHCSGTQTTNCINTASNSASTFNYQNIMNTVSSNYQGMADNATTADNAAKANVSNLQQQLAAAQASGSTTEIAAIQSQLDQAQIDQSLTSYHRNATGILNTVYSGGDAVNGANGANTNTFLQSDLSTLNAAQVAENSAYSNALNAAGGDPTATQSINAEHSVTTSGITVNTDYVNAMENGTTDYTTAINDINAQVQAANALAAQPENLYNTNLQAETQQLDTAAQADITNIQDSRASINDTSPAN